MEIKALYTLNQLWQLLILPKHKKINCRTACIKPNILMVKPLTSKLMDSMTSMKTSFFLYLMPSDLQDTALVTVVGTLVLATSSLVPSCVMYLERQPVWTSVAWSQICFVRQWITRTRNWQDSTYRSGIRLSQDKSQCTCSRHTV